MSRTLHQIFWSLSCISLLFSVPVKAQNYDIGQWSSHLSNRSVTQVEEFEYTLFAATSNNIFEYKIQSGEFTTYSTVQGLSDINISKIKYARDHGFLMIGYTSGNIDYLFEDRVETIPDIEQNTSLSSKTIKNIHFYGDTAFLACDFGLVIINVPQREIQSTYFLGTSQNPVTPNDVTVAFDSIWVPTDKGLYVAQRTGINLHNYQNWSKATKIPDGDSAEFLYAELIGDTLFVARNEYKNESEKIYKYRNGNYNGFLEDLDFDVHQLDQRGNNNIIITNQRITAYNNSMNHVGNYWFQGYNDYWGAPADALYRHGFFMADPEYGVVAEENGDEYLLVPNSPFSNSANQIVTSRGKVLVTGGMPGTKTNGLGMYLFDGQWKNINGRNISALANIKNLNYAAFDPGDNSHIFASSYGFGVVEMRDTNVLNHFHTENSSLANINNYVGNYILTTGIQFDQQGDVWVTTNGVMNPLNVYKNNNEWESFNLGGTISNAYTKSLITTPWGHLWFIEDDYGLVAFDPEKLKSGDIANGYKRFRAIGSDNSVLSSNITTLTVDKTNYIWLGLGEGGIGVYYDAESVFDYDLQASRIIVEKDGIAQYLLEHETVSAIAVDAGNQKWIGTVSGGVFLISEEGTEQILNLNTENSPLLSNYIRDIGIDHQKGWVYFATDKGVIAYYSGIIEADASISNMRAYPNPVHEDYNEFITITGLTDKMKVKIADVAGNIIFETETKGGTALWNMRDFRNQRVSTGVYMIYASTIAGEERGATKIFVVSK